MSKDWRSQRKNASPVTHELYLFGMVDTGDPSASVETMIFDQLAEADLPALVADLVVAALLGDDDLDAALGSQGWERPPAPEGVPADAVPRFFLRSVTVEGFPRHRCRGHASRAARSRADADRGP